MQSLSTSGHGSFTSADFNNLIELSQGKNTIVLTSKQTNFYLKKLILQEVDFAIDHNIPSKINAWEFSESSQNVPKSPRGSGYEIRFKQGLSLSYNLNNPDEEKIFDIDLEYSSKKRVPKLDISLNNQVQPLETLTETAVHGSFQKKVVVRAVFIPKNSSILIIKSKGYNFYLKNLRLSESQEIQDPNGCEVLMFDTTKIDASDLLFRLSNEEIKNRFLGYGFSHKVFYNSLISDKPYNVIETFKLDDIVISFWHSLKSKYVSYPQMIITFHLSQFASFKSFKNLVQDIFQEHSDCILNESRIIRLDFCIEVTDIEYGHFVTNFRRKNVQTKNFREWS